MSKSAVTRCDSSGDRVGLPLFIGLAGCDDDEDDDDRAGGGVGSALALVGVMER